VRRATTLRFYLVRTFLGVFFTVLVLPALILEIVDLFPNLWRYISLDASPRDVGRIMLLYLPSAISNSLPIALLFAVAFSLGSLYANNELTVVFGSGLSLAQFMSPLFIVAAFLSVASFLFDDRVVLPTLREKNRLSRQLLRQSVPLSNADLALISKDGRFVYRAEYYDESGPVLSGVTVVERDASGSPVARIEAATARWDAGKWLFGRVRRFEKRADGSWTEASFGSWTGEGLDEAPDAFRNQNRDLQEMPTEDLAAYVSFLERAGLPYAAALAERHKRYAFAITPLVVVLIAGAVGGRFRKNILLMSILSSLLSATCYYVAQMIAMLLAKTGVLDPEFGAWLPLIVFAIVGSLAFKFART
jgi:lipopolysaccharide export system permease protein